MRNTEVQIEGSPQGDGLGGGLRGGPTDDLRAELDVRQGRYRVRFARSERDLDLLFRLRYEVFNVELDEGLAESRAERRDRDEYDEHCEHLLVELQETGEIVGTYRMQFPEVARAARGLYVESEFDLSAIPRDVLDRAVELGRACITRAHRSKKVLFLLWCGLAHVVQRYERRYLFGCSSLTSQDPAVGLRLARDLERQGRRHPELVANPLPAFECRTDVDLDRVPAIEVPTLFATYLRYGAHVLGPPALDRRFGTIDFLTLLDVEEMDPRTFALFT